MLSILGDGIVVFEIYKDAFIVFFISVLGLGMLSIRYFVSFDLDFGTRVAASICAGVVNLCVISFSLVAISYFFPFVLKVGSFAVFCLASIVLLRDLIAKRAEVGKQGLLLIGGVALFVLLLIRLAFLKHIILPPYSDSPIHYQIVRGFLDSEVGTNSNLSIGNIFKNYYHFGFHSLVAWLSSITNTNPLNGMSFIGQLFLVIAPLSIIFAVKIITGDGASALFGGLLTAVGWYMPAFAENWGKYPALASLAVLPAVAALLYLWKLDRKHSFAHYFWVCVLVAGMALLHTRAIVTLLLFMICIMAANRFLLDHKFGAFQSVRFALLYIFALWPLKTYLVDFYSGWMVAVVLCLLLPFAFREFSKISVAVLLFTLGIWLITDFPHLFNPNYRGVLDRQYVEMMLYIPLSLLDGMSVAGVLKSPLLSNNLRLPVMAILVGIVLLSFSYHSAIRPDPCCDYFKEADQSAFSWLQNHAKKNDLVLISVFDNNGQMLGTDAGIWVYPLLGLNTNKIRFDTEWTEQSDVSGLCANSTNDVFIYAGGRSFSFSEEQLSQKIEFQEVFRTGETRIYELTSCIR